MSVKISVIVPIYNQIDYLDKCICSICSQIYRNLEIILVDDGSSRFCREMCDGYRNRDERIKVIHKENGGAHSARKAGIEVATGDYIAFVDSDDWIELDFYKEMAIVAENDCSDMIVTSNFYRNYSNGSFIDAYNNDEKGYWDKSEFEEKVFPHFIKTDSFFDTDYPISMCTCLFKSDFCRTNVQKIRNNLNIAEDYLFLMIALLNAESFSAIPYRGYHYRCNLSSITYTVKNVKEQLRLAYEAADKAISQCSYNQEELRKKNRLFMFHAFMLTDYKEILKMEKNYLFPYSKIIKGSKVVIYGAGRLGKQIYNAIKYCNEYKIIGLADKNWKLYREQGLEVLSPEEVLGLSFDYIIIAVTYINVRNEIKKGLMGLGVPEEKFVEIDINLMDEIHLPF